MEFKYDELKQLLEKSDGFMINVTTRNGEKLNHYFFNEKFFDGDMLPSCVEGEKLIVNKLKQPKPIEDATIVTTIEAEEVNDKDSK